MCNQSFHIFLFLFLRFLSQMFQLLLTFAFVQLLMQIFLVEMVILLLIFIPSHFQKFIVLGIVAGWQLFRRNLGWMVESLGLLVEIDILIILAELALSLLLFLLAVLELMANAKNRFDVSFGIGLGIAFDGDHGRFIADDRLLLSLFFVLFVQINLVLFFFLLLLLLVLGRLVLLLTFLCFFLKSLLHKFVHDLCKGKDSLLITLDNIAALDLGKILFRECAFLHQDNQNSVDGCLLRADLVGDSFPLLAQEGEEDVDYLQVPVSGLQGFDVEITQVKLEDFVDGVPDFGNCWLGHRKCINLNISSLIILFLGVFLRSAHANKYRCTYFWQPGPQSSSYLILVSRYSGRGIGDSFYISLDFVSTPLPHWKLK